MTSTEQFIAFSHTGHPTAPATKRCLLWPMHEGFPAPSLGLVGWVLAGEDCVLPAPVVNPYVFWLPGPLGSHWSLLCPDTNKLNIFYETSATQDVQGAEVKTGVRVATSWLLKQAKMHRGQLNPDILLCHFIKNLVNFY